LRLPFAGDWIVDEVSRPPSVKVTRCCSLETTALKIITTSSLRTRTIVGSLGPAAGGVGGHHPAARTGGQHACQRWPTCHQSTSPIRVIVGIETDRGPWVTALRAAGYKVFAINPLSAARYRQRHFTSGAKSDADDAHVLADIVRLDRDHHRAVPRTPALRQEVLQQGGPHPQHLTCPSHTAVWCARASSLIASARALSPAIREAITGSSQSRV